jgi:hypothetical protein
MLSCINTRYSSWSGHAARRAACTSLKLKNSDINQTPTKFYSGQVTDPPKNVQPPPNSLVRQQNRIQLFSQPNGRVHDERAMLL